MVCFVREGIFDICFVMSLDCLVADRYCSMNGTQASLYLPASLTSVIVLEVRAYQLGSYLLYSIV